MTEPRKTNQVMTREFLAERDSRIFKMRQAGVSVAEIGKRFGVSTAVVQKAVQRQLEKLNKETLMAYPEVLRMELERLDNLQAAIWPLTQHRKIRTDDGTEIQVEPDLKAIQQVLSIMDRRSKLLGMEQNVVNVQMDISSNETVKSSLAGAENQAIALDTFSAESEARQLLEIMGRSGVLPSDVVDRLLYGDKDIIDAEEIPALETSSEERQNEQR